MYRVNITAASCKQFPVPMLYRQYVFMLAGHKLCKREAIFLTDKKLPFDQKNRYVTWMNRSLSLTVENNQVFIMSANCSVKRLFSLPSL